MTSHTYDVFTTEEYGDLVSQYDGSDTLYHQCDGLGSTDALLDEWETATDRYAHRAFGLEAARSGTTDNPFTYVGRQGYYKDPELELYLLGARYYDPALGRFLSQDPIGFEAGDANLLRYVANSPTTATDPTGKWIRKEPWSGDRGTYKGVAIAEEGDTLEGLATLVTGNPEDGQRLLARTVAKGTRVDIFPLLNALEDRLRQRAVVNARGMSKKGPTFGGPGADGFLGAGAPLSEKVLRDFFDRGERSVTDCGGAAYLALSRALLLTIESGEFDELFAGEKGIPFKDQNVSSRESLPGDWGIIFNDPRYGWTYRGGRIGGPWRMENVITTGEGLFCGFPLGDKTVEDWERILVEEFNRDLKAGTKEATRARGWRNDRVKFLDVAEIAMRLFDLRSTRRDR
jgi:RHS repeat-associated protein